MYYHGLLYVIVIIIFIINLTIFSLAVKLLLHITYMYTLRKDLQTSISTGKNKLIPAVVAEEEAVVSTAVVVVSAAFVVVPASVLVVSAVVVVVVSAGVVVVSSIMYITRYYADLRVYLT